jgi:phosphoribosylanthranilate isomerase
VFVKICGLQSEEALDAAVEHGADAVGFVLAHSPRRVSYERFRELSRRVAGRTLRVAVVRQVATTEAEEWVRQGDADLVQAEAFLPVWPRSPYLLVRALELGEPFTPVEGARPFAYVFDRRVQGRSGGTGQQADWAEARRWAREVRLILAGGLQVENVADAVAAVEPFGVDVSSGVEVAGAKSPERIVAFLAAAKGGGPL